MKKNMCPIPGALLLPAILVLAMPLIPGRSALAQEEVVPLVRGEVRVGDDPLGGVTVVLHQVSSEASGAIDSVQAGPEGAFELLLPRLPAHEVDTGVYFASVRYRDLLYFGPAITAPAQLDSLYLIQAYDTTSVPQGGAVLPLAARALFLDRGGDGWDATDFFQLRNDGERTLFSPEEEMTWQYPLPPSASDFQVGQGDLGPDAVRFQGGTVQLFSPIPPGERFLLVRYRIPGDAFTVPMPGVTERMELLVRQPGPQVEVDPLRPGTPVELEPGNVFARHEGVNLVDAQLTGRLLDEGFRLGGEWLAVILAVVLGGAGVFAYRIRRSPVQARPPPRGREDVIGAIAELDESFQTREDRGPGARSRYLARREKLLQELKRLS